MSTPRTAGSSVVSLPEVAAAVPDGGHLALTGFAITRNAVAACHELIRAGRRDLTLTQVNGGLETDLLVGAGCVAHVNYSGGSLDRFGPLHAVNRALAAGAVTVAEYSALSLTLRLQAGALGLPFVPTRSLLGSELLPPLLDTGEVRHSTDPFTGTPVLLLAPLRPDVAIVHADIADEHGNASLSGPTWSLRETALAAETVLVTCEELVPAGTLPPDAVRIPGTLVRAVAQVPHGAHPTSVHGRYDYDRAHLEAYVRAAREGPAGFVAYLEEFVHAVGVGR
jgi:glutaconate CoA-transferase subunit A